MKKFLLFAAVLSLAAYVNGQSCTPNTSITTSGTYPDSLPMGTAGSYYEEVIQFRIPADTNADLNGTPVYAVIDSIKVLEVIGMPDGLNYLCNPSSCALPGGETSCGVIYGNIDGAADGYYPFTIPVKIYARIGGTFPYQLPDTIYSISMYVDQPSGATLIQNAAIRAYPNPANGHITLALPFSAGTSVLQVYTQQGQLIECPYATAENRMELDTRHLSPGLYYAVVTHANRQYRLHFAVSR